MILRRTTGPEHRGVQNAVTDIDKSRELGRRNRLVCCGLACRARCRRRRSRAAERENHGGQPYARVTQCAITFVSQTFDAK